MHIEQYPAPPVNVLAEAQVDGYTVQVYNFKDTCLPDSPPPPDWNVIVYRVLWGSRKVRNVEKGVPLKVCLMGTQLVKIIKQGGQQPNLL
jgi:hypothetical protein